jgi:hypothetical protein
MSKRKTEYFDGDTTDEEVTTKRSNTLQYHREEITSSNILNSMLGKSIVKREIKNLSDDSDDNYNNNSNKLQKTSHNKRDDYGSSYISNNYQGFFLLLFYFNFKDIFSKFMNISILEKNIDKSSSTVQSEKSLKMMRAMGYVDGKGLGKKEQGIVEPIGSSNQTGKLGLGFAKKNFDKVCQDWDVNDDPISCFETPIWLVNETNEMPSLEEISSWKEIGIKKKILDDEDNFCSKEILKSVLDCKSIFDDLSNKEMLDARRRSNPYEAIGAQFFQNRAALKMANIDAVFDFIFTNPSSIVNENQDDDDDSKREQVKRISKIKPNEPLYFCDVCAGPGGFSEYILWRRKWRSKGFGFTLKCENDFQLDDFLAGRPEYFENHYGLL